MKMPFLLISPKIVLKNLLIKKGGCFKYHPVIADKIKYCHVHRASICPALGMDNEQLHSDIYLHLQRPPKIESLANFEPIGRCKTPLN